MIRNLPTLAFQIFDPVGLQIVLTGLNRFTCVTARVSLYLRLAHVVTSVSLPVASRRTIAGGQPVDLPVLAHGVSVHARGLRPREVDQ